MASRPSWRRGRRCPWPMLGRGRPETTDPHPRDHHPGTLACGARPAESGRRIAGLRPPPRPGVEHGETLCPRTRTRSIAPPTVLRPAWSTPIATICAAAASSSPVFRSCTCSTRSQRSATPASLNLLHKYLNQGRAESDRITPSPRRLTSWIMSRPNDLPAGRRTHLACEGEQSECAGRAMRHR